MADLLTIARFELRYYGRQPYFYGLLLLMVAQGLATGVLHYEQVADGSLLTNAPALLYLGFANTGVLLVASLALLTGQALLRDRDYRVGTYLYTFPISAKAYFSGQFLGTLALGVGLGGSYALGLLLVPCWVSGPVGSWPVGAFLDGFMRVLLPNLLLVVCLSFALTALFRHIAGAYLALLTLTLGSTLLQLSYASVVALDWVHLLDPFGAISVRQAVETMTTLEKNTGLLDMPALLYINRLLWLGLGGWLLTRADAQLSFPYMLDSGPGWIMANWLPIARNRRAALHGQTGQQAAEGQLVHARPTRSFTTLTRCKTAFYLALADARWLVRQPAVAVGLLLLVLGIVAYALGVGDAPAGPLSGGQRLLPFTARMTAIRLPMHPYISLFLLVFTGELIHRNRTSGTWYLADATPQPGWVFLLGQVGAMTLLTTAITAVLLVTGIGLQWLNGQTPIDWVHYANDLLVDSLLRYSQLIAVAALVSVVVPNRLVGHGLSLMVLAGLTYFDQKSGGTAWWLYSILPGSAAYSDITGYGTFAPLRPISALLWTTMAAGLLLLATRLAQRGVLVGSQALFRRGVTGLTTPYFAGFIVAVGVATGCVFWLTATSRLTPQSTVAITPYNTTTQQVQLASGQRVNVMYHFVHPQNLLAVQAAAAQALQQGERWLGTFPHQTLHITETPFRLNPGQPLSTPAFVSLPERDGWMTNTTRTDDAGQLALAVARQVLNQWLANGFAPVHPASSGLLTDGLAGYLALRVVQAELGDDWLKGQLARQEAIYRRGRGQSNRREPVVMLAPGNTYVATAKAPLSLTCIGEVWGHEALCRQIGQFYQHYHAPQSTSPDAYVADLLAALPDEYKYVADYLRERPQFSLAIGAIGVYDDRLSVQIVAQKTLDDGLGHTREKLLNDYVPIALLDARGRIIHRELVLPYTAGRDDKVFWLPRPTNAVTISIDPLGAWPEANRTDNRKQLVRL